MWAIFLACLLLSINSVFGQENTADAVRNQTDISPENLTADYLSEFFNETWNLATSAANYFSDKPTTTHSDHTETGRRYGLKYKGAELRFITKALLVLKILLGVFLPFGIIASKILSWKAVTLSLMAFMLAKILFVKNLLGGKNAFSLTPTNFLPPVLIQGNPNDLFWKRQGETQAGYPWTSP